MDDKKIKLVASITKSAIITVIFIVAVTLAADLMPSLKDWLKNTFSHHWLGKGILSIAIFSLFSIIAYFFLPSQKDIEKTKKLLSTLIWTSVGGSAVIFIFFIWEAFLK